MRKAVVAFAVLTAITIAAPRARAQMPVTDHANLLQNVKTALQTYQIVQNTVQQIQMMQTQLTYQLQTLKSIDPTSFTGLLALLNQGEMTSAMIQGDLSTIGYDINSVNRNFDRLFPKNQSQWQSVRYSDFNGYYDGWNSQINASSKAAVRAQANIASLDANDKAIANILISANNSSTGEVRQLQLVNQQLGLIHDELGKLVQNLSTVGRVITDWTAGGVGEEMMSRERARRRLDGYTLRGKPSRVLNRLP